ncbi:TonB-dependent receptor [Sphingomonas immobilis]|uniref:TonB-dependent receptor n=1 Tax=Sphingomonas immobilis TaxID=3063997 RepID=A0ABT9A0Q9_9SPHN|nr:TonB-dependent receptor [Sphingomonas sp. CA1-15]MDO7843413.1 TonB-dependent receptor [Sphingomonas sp. CA1-15]
MSNFTTTPRGAKAALMRSAVSLAALAASATPAFAMDAPAATAAIEAPEAPAADQAESQVPGDIVVTARRKEESLQEVPLAISAITGEQLRAAGVRNIRDIAYLTPGVTINSGGAEYTTQPIIRGVVGLGGNSGVVSFIDAVPLPGAASVNVSMLDISRVEIVKGPVAALYGQNAYSGVINYVTRVPGNTFSLDAEATAASGDLYQFKGFVNVPVVSDLLAVSVAGNYENYGGGFRDSVNGNKTGGYEKKDVRASVNFTPTDRLSIAGSFYYGNDVFDVTPLVYATNNCGALSTNVNTRGQFTNYCGSLNFNPLEVASIPKNAGVAGNQREVFLGNVRAHYDIGYGDIGLLVGYQKSDTHRFNDFTGTRSGIPFVGSDGRTYNLLEYFGSDNNDKGWNAELRYTSPQNKPLRFAFGGFYQANDSYSNTIISVDGTPLPTGVTLVDPTALRYLTVNGAPANAAATASFSTTKSYSGFISADYDPFAGMTLSGEYRRGHATVDAYNTSGLTNPIVTLAPYTFSYDTDSYRLSAKYKITPHIMVYASYGQGVKPAGVNPRATIASERYYGAETSKTYELGFKSSFWNNRVQVNAAIFQIDSTNFQINGPSDDPTNAGLVIKNFGGARNRGFEFETSFRPNRFFGLHYGIAYVDPKFSAGTLDFSFGTICATTPYCDQSRVVRVTTASGATRLALNLAGLQLPRVSKLTASGGVDFNGDVTDTISWFGRADVRYESKQYAQQDDNAYYGERIGVNLRAGIKTEKYSITAYVDNLTNNQTPEQVLKLTRLNDFQGNLSGYLPLPRTYGVTVSASF